ncbi:MAG: hypothetical protein EOP48_10010, partial [Sphingobacteriales bacterium]
MLVLALFSFFNDINAQKVSGSILNAPGILILHYYDDDDVKRHDTIRIINGKFSRSLHTKTALLLAIEISDFRIQLYVQPESRITLEADAKNRLIFNKSLKIIDTPTYLSITTEAKKHKLYKFSWNYELPLNSFIAELELQRTRRDSLRKAAALTISKYPASLYLRKSLVTDSLDDYYFTRRLIVDYFVVNKPDKDARQDYFKTFIYPAIDTDNPDLISVESFFDYCDKVFTADWFFQQIDQR